MAQQRSEVWPVGCGGAGVVKGAEYGPTPGSSLEESSGRSTGRLCCSRMTVPTPALAAPGRIHALAALGQWSEL